MFDIVMVPIVDFQQWFQDNPIGKEESFQQMVLHIQGNEAGHLPHNIFKNELKLDQRPTCKS